MAGTVERRLAELGIELPKAAAPAANYVPTVQSGNLLLISGQIPTWNGEHWGEKGRLGAEVGLDEGKAIARVCALNILAQAKRALGDLDRVARVVKLGGFVASTADFTDHPAVINGASDLMAEVFGEKGQHSRFAVGVAALPFGVAVEVDAVLEITD